MSKFKFEYYLSGKKHPQWKWRFVSTANGKIICWASGYNSAMLAKESIALINEGRWPVEQIEK